MEAIRIVEAGDLKKDRGGFRPGDTVKVMVKVVEEIGRNPIGNQDPFAVATIAEELAAATRKSA